MLALADAEAQGAGAIKTTSGSKKGLELVLGLVFRHWRMDEKDAGITVAATDQLDGVHSQQKWLMGRLCG